MYRPRQELRHDVNFLGEHQDWVHVRTHSTICDLHILIIKFHFTTCQYVDKYLQRTYPHLNSSYKSFPFFYTGCFVFLLATNRYKNKFRKPSPFAWEPSLISWPLGAKLREVKKVKKVGRYFTGEMLGNLASVASLSNFCAAFASILLQIDFIWNLRGNYVKFPSLLIAWLGAGQCFDHKISFGWPIFRPQNKRFSQLTRLNLFLENTASRDFIRKSP